MVQAVGTDYGLRFLVKLIWLVVGPLPLLAVLASGHCGSGTTAGGLNLQTSGIMEAGTGPSIGSLVPVSVKKSAQPESDRAGGGLHHRPKQ